MQAHRYLNHVKTMVGQIQPYIAYDSDSGSRVTAMQSMVGCILYLLFREICIHTGISQNFGSEPVRELSEVHSKWKSSLTIAALCTDGILECAISLNM